MKNWRPIHAAEELLTASRGRKYRPERKGEGERRKEKLKALHHTTLPCWDSVGNTGCERTRALCWIPAAFLPPPPCVPLALLDGSDLHLGFT
ncbi:hypothetical protein PHYPO_G00065740 [Pangasianodon hypophthalmus]|uniref:Uncharacterized protein n=1 Tax=Pangasianodon hypophthalmus TaxID=310915 RepID=A0A5N5M4F7_PANHP|nr:hypothetical protein PHYPO_G00065740 [Pangasianodon hypophthalmus]